MATGQTRFIGGIIPKKSIVPGKIPTGTTVGEIFSNLSDRKLWGFDGSISFEYGSNSYLGLTGGTITGDTRIIGTFLTDMLIVTGVSQLSTTTSMTFSGGTMSGGTIYSGNTNLSDIFHQKNGYLLQKAGSVTGSTFAGNPKTATVTFTTNFPNNNYAVSIIADVSRSWSIELKTLSGFTINANANVAFNSGNVYWTATETGEGYK